MSDVISDIRNALRVDTFCDANGYTAHLAALAEAAHDADRHVLGTLLHVLADEPDMVRAPRALVLRGLVALEERRMSPEESAILACAADVLAAEARALEQDAAAMSEDAS